ncbi:MAG: glycosyltransferase family 2 protein [Planctomycetes bacterium]|nr:glycosyltransferase family 2 protein [Planctomycetota bacterium]
MSERELPELSLIMPCYNEQEAIPYTIPQLVQAFAKAGHRLELIAVDNGSKDRTGEVIKAFEAQGTGVVHHRVEPNEGYGNGVLKTFAVCRAPWIGIIPADGQVDAEDVARLFEAVKHTDGMVLGKVRRRFRMDGPLRKVVSVAYNALVYVLYPRLGSIDINGSPKIIHRDVLAVMDCKEKQWFLDPEMMIKAHHLGVRVLEMNVFARMRSNGLSHVRGSTCIEFLKKLFAYRFGGALSEWKRRQPKVVFRETPRKREAIAH